MTSLPRKRASCDVNVSPPDLEVSHASSASFASLSACSYPGQATPPAHPGAPDTAGRGPTRTHCPGRSCPSHLEFAPACPTPGAQCSSCAQMATPLARDPFTQGSAQIRSTSSFSRSGSRPGNRAGLQPASISWRSPGSLESSSTGPLRGSYSWLASYLSQHHWPLACSRADPSLAFPFLAAYPGPRSVSGACSSCAPGV